MDRGAFTLRSRLPGLVAASLACSTVTSVLGTTSGGGLPAGGQGTGGPTDDLFTDCADPVDVSVALEAGSAATAVITPEGGRLQAEDAAGNRFTLDIPDGALTVETEITLTPVAAIEGPPMTHGMVGAVQFEPDGRFLYQDAILTIEPAQDVPVENQILFGYLGTGQDLHLAIPRPDCDEIQVRVPHFSGFGLGSGIGTHRANLLLKRAADHEVRIRQQVAEYLSRERQAALMGAEGSGLAGMDGFIEPYCGLVVRSRILAASSSCDNARPAIQTLLGWERQRALLGLSGSSQGDTMTEAAGLMETAYAECREEAVQKCQAKVDPTILIRFELGAERERALLGVSRGTLPANLVEEAVKICGTAFEVSGRGVRWSSSGGSAASMSPLNWSSAARVRRAAWISFRRACSAEPSSMRAPETGSHRPGKAPTRSRAWSPARRWKAKGRGVSPGRPSTAVGRILSRASSRC